ncbi:MAG: Gfo/Idh/MocA family oxidoreductase [Planctomycetota bacterium]|nr:Gfo/Idh/MocA family oxidoreductase [Planctomycetota bacterium]
MRETLTVNINDQKMQIDEAGRVMQPGRRAFLKGAIAAGAALAIPSWVTAAEAQIPAGKKLRFGYIGRGSVSHAYLPTLAEAEFVELVSICDLIEGRARDGATRHKIPNVYPNIDAMLAGPKFDLLVNTTSMPSHFPVNKKALEAGCNVWSEKPIALEVKDAYELLELAKKKGVQIWVAPTCVTSPQFRFMSDMIQGGKIGRVTAGHGTYGHGGPTWSAWFYEKGGGSLYDLGVYNVTTLTGLLGPVKSVMGMTAILNKTRKVDDKGEVTVTADENTMLIMDHGNGILSHVQTGFGYFEPERAPSRERKLYTVDIMGTTGAMHMQGWDWAPAAVDVATEGHAILQPQCRDKWPYEWVGGARYVATCLLTGQKSLITAEHGLHVLEVMNACHRSQETGRRIAVESTFKWPLFT